MTDETRTIHEASDLGEAVDPATVRLAGRLFRVVRQTFLNRDLCQQRQDGSLREVEWIGWAPWFERRAFAFVLDTGTLPVSIEKLTDPRVSTAGSRRMSACRRTISCMPKARQIVTTAGSPSGTAAIARLTATINISIRVWADAVR